MMMIFVWLQLVFIMIIVDVVAAAIIIVGFTNGIEIQVQQSFFAIEVNSGTC